MLRNDKAIRTLNRSHVTVTNICNWQICFIYLYVCYCREVGPEREKRLYLDSVKKHVSDDQGRRQGGSLVSALHSLHVAQDIGGISFLPCDLCQNMLAHWAKNAFVRCTLVLVVTEASSEI